MDPKAEWIRVKEPLSREEKMFINLATAECVWEIEQTKVDDLNSIRECNEQWWELFDERTNRFYYYNSNTMETKWEKPFTTHSFNTNNTNSCNDDQQQRNCVVIPLHKLKVMKKQREEMKTKRGGGGRAFDDKRNYSSVKLVDKESQTIETLKVLVDCESQTDSTLGCGYTTIGSGSGGAYYSFAGSGGGTQRGGENSLKDYLMSEARFAGFSYDLYLSEDYNEEWDADDEGDDDPDDEDEDDDEENDDDEEDVEEDESDDGDDEGDDEDESEFYRHLQQPQQIEIKRIEKEDELNGGQLELKPPIPPKRENSLQQMQPKVQQTTITSPTIVATIATTNAAKRKQDDDKVKGTSTSAVKSGKKEEKDEENLELFAKENIKRHIKKGGVNLLLKRKESMKGMLIWTKNSIKQPMIATIMNIGGGMKQEAIQCFKLIQEYCGDRQQEAAGATAAAATATIIPIAATLEDEQQQRLQIAYDLITKGVNKGVCLRDEIYVQLCRQTTENPSLESCKKGLQLMTMCLFYFGPSSKFAPYLYSFLFKHKLNNSETTTAVDEHEEARICLKVAQNKLEKRLNLMRQFNETSDTSGFTKRPSAVEYKEELQMILNCIQMGSTGWFGESLQSTLDKQQQYDQHQHRQLPWIQVELSEIILKLNGLKTEGIFRIGPDFEEMAAIRLSIECGNELKIAYNEDDDVNIYASLLKQWFRELSSPVIPTNLYDKCLKYCESPQYASDLILNHLPILNKLSIGYLIRFLQVFAAQQNVSKTKMDENNLSMVWSPNILRSPQQHHQTQHQSQTTPSITVAAGSLFENARREMLFIKTLIKHLNTSFIQGII